MDHRKKTKVLEINLHSHNQLRFWQRSLNHRLSKRTLSVNSVGANTEGKVRDASPSSCTKITSDVNMGLTIIPGTMKLPLLLLLLLKTKTSRTFFKLYFQKNSTQSNGSSNIFIYFLLCLAPLQALYSSLDPSTSLLTAFVTPPALMSHVFHYHLFIPSDIFPLHHSQELSEKREKFLRYLKVEWQEVKIFSKTKEIITKVMSLPPLTVGSTESGMIIANYSSNVWLISCIFKELPKLNTPYSINRLTN